MPELDYFKIGQRIKDARMAAGLSQEELAEECGTTGKYLCSIENGKRRPSLALLTSLSSKLNVSVDSFLKDNPVVCRRYLVDTDIAGKIDQLRQPYLHFLDEFLDNLIVLQKNDKD